MKLLDKLLHRKVYKGEIVYLKESYRVDDKNAYDGVGTVYYNIYNCIDDKRIGKIELRDRVDGPNYYYGHIGYDIDERYRGHHYALEACKLLFKIARDEFGMDELIITCSPNNIASYKTLTKLNGELVKTCLVPPGHLLYTMGEKEKCIFRYDLKCYNE